MKVTVSLDDTVEVKLTNFGALLYNARKTKGLNQAQLKEFFNSSDNKNEGDTLRLSFYNLVSLFGADWGELHHDCFVNNEFTVVPPDSSY